MKALGVVAGQEARDFMTTTETLEPGNAAAFVSALSHATKQVAFMVGAPLSSADGMGSRGVPGIDEMVTLVRERLSPRAREQLERVLPGNDAAGRYQAALGVLGLWHSQDDVNKVIQTAVRGARFDQSGDSRLTNEDIETDLDGWSLPAGTRDLGRLLMKDPSRWAGPVLTTNFDPLLSVAIRRAGGIPVRTIVDADGRLEGTEVDHPSARRIAHLHGYWLRSDTLHTRPQLVAARPQLSASLRSLLRRRTLAVVAYGGWDDVFTRALAEVVTDEQAELDILWAFYDDDPTSIAKRYESLLGMTRDARIRGRVRLYGGVNCHQVFGELVSPEPVSGPAAFPANKKREPFQLLVAESGTTEPASMLAVVGALLVQDLDVLAREADMLQQDLLRAPYVLADERRAIRARGISGATSTAARERVLDFLGRADFDLYAYCAPRSPGASLETIREGLLAALLRNRLTARKWPLATISSSVPGIAQLLGSISSELRGANPVSPFPEVGHASPACLALAETCCTIVRDALEQRQATGSASTAALERIRTKLRAVRNVITGEEFHRRKPLT